MEYQVMCIYDRKAGIYSNVWLSVNVATAQREFANTAKQSPFADDLECYHLGLFNPQTGVLTGNAKPEFVCAFNTLESEK